MYSLVRAQRAPARNFTVSEVNRERSRLAAVSCMLCYYAIEEKWFSAAPASVGSTIVKILNIYVTSFVFHVSCST